MLVFPQIQVGSPVHHKALTVFPLFTLITESVDYILSDEALSAGTIAVEEVNAAGSVPQLVANNQADMSVLFLEGEELRGAKQNRVLNVSVLIPAKTQLTIPVSCVEQGRWHYCSRRFSSAGSHASAKLRYVLKKSVTRSARSGSGHASDQLEVWKEVDRQMKALRVSSATAAMADIYEANRLQLAEYQDQIPYVQEATGLAVAIGDKVVSVDLFDKPATCRKVWKRLLTGLVLDALEAETRQEQAKIEDVHQLLAALRQAPWQSTPLVGAGEEYRADTAGGHASALVLNEVLIHVSWSSGDESPHLEKGCGRAAAGGAVRPDHPRHRVEELEP